MHSLHKVHKTNTLWGVPVCLHVTCKKTAVLILMKYHKLHIWIQV